MKKKIMSKEKKSKKNIGGIIVVISILVIFFLVFRPQNTTSKEKSLVTCPDGETFAKTVNDCPPSSMKEDKESIQKLSTSKISSELLDYDANNVREYTVVKTEDKSHKAMDKPLSSYSVSELNELPVDVKISYRVVVPTDITKDQLKNTIKKLITDELQKNEDIDEIIIFVYDRKEDVNGMYTFARAIYAPNGQLGDVTPQIASSNDKNSYKITWEINDKVGNIQETDRPTEKEFEIYRYFDDRLFEETDKMYDAQDAGLPYKYSNSAEVENAVIKEVANKYGISEEEVDRIFMKVLAYNLK